LPLPDLTLLKKLTKLKKLRHWYISTKLEQNIGRVHVPEKSYT